jgi:DNA-binding NarL/FixJ family response regulator
MKDRKNQGKCIHVLVADSDLIRRKLLVRELQRQAGLKISGCDNEVSACRHALGAFPADVLLWVASSQCDAKQVFSGIRETLRFRPTLRCIALLESWDRENTISAFRAGVRGLFSLDQGSLLDLRKCISCVFRDQVWANGPQILVLIEAFKRSPVVQILDVKGKNLLTARQQELVQLVAEGMGNREVAQRLNITENTVKKALLRIFDKVGVSNRVELVLAALAFDNPQHQRNTRVPKVEFPIASRSLFDEQPDVSGTE